MRIPSIHALLFLLLPGTLCAQPVLTAATHLPQSGDTLVRHYSGTATLFPGPSGANVVWNFSALTPGTAIDSGWFQSTLPMPPWAFNMSYENHATAPVAYDYYHVTPDSLGLMGRDHSAADLDPVQLFNPDKLLVFPMTYGTNFVDTYSGQLSAFMGIVPFSGVTHVNADAFGTVILPGATFNDVLRVHKRDTITSVLLPSGLVQDMWFFYSATRRYPVLVICENCFISGDYVYSNQRSTLSSREAPQEALPSFAPNPWEGVSRFHSPVAGMISIMAADGRLVLSRQVRAGETLLLDRALAPAAGVYLLRFQGQRHQWSQRVLAP